MGTIERITITLTAEMAQTLRAAVKGGDYATSSEIVREALRDWSHKRTLQQHELEQLRAEINKGIADIEAGRSSDFDPQEIVGLGERRLRRARSK
jgi:antitoxin ParD1/3/4